MQITKFIYRDYYHQLWNLKRTDPSPHGTYFPWIIDPCVYPYIWGLLPPPKIIKNRLNFAPSKKPLKTTKNRVFYLILGKIVIFPVYTGQKRPKKTLKNPDTSSAFFEDFSSKNRVFPVYGDFRDPKIAKKPRFRPAGHPP